MSYSLHGLAVTRLHEGPVTRVHRGMANRFTRYIATSWLRSPVAWLHDKIVKRLNGLTMK